MINDFVQKLKERLNDYKTAQGYTYFDHYEVTTTKGTKFTKVFKAEVRPDGSIGNRSIVAFIDNVTGDIFKPASCNAPAKHARGNIHSAQNGMESIDAQGFVYYLR